jgi:hypothetical protein
MDESYGDDPEAGVYWRLPQQPNGTPTRWSKAWFDWRSEPVTARKAAKA